MEINAVLKRRTMKTLRDFRFPLLVLIGSFIILLFTSYGNKKVHPDLNSFMIDAFLKQNNTGSFPASDFKNYSFNLEEISKIKGTAITKEGLFNVGDIAAGGVMAGIGAMVEKNVVSVVYAEEGPAEMTPRQWIVTGGYSADVPEIPASLRHFYDPTRPAGDRYLTDITNAKIMGSLQKYAFTNPKIDGLRWALGTPGDKSNGPQDHQYTWERGKMWVQMALKETNQDKKNEYMALAWRSLGETLHMIADHGCPPHVRNDAHPSPLWGNNNLFGNPDPYEEFMDIIRRDYPDNFAAFAKGSADPSLTQQFRSATRAETIAHDLAVFTNINFVTNETISGTDKEGTFREQITHPQYPYFAPLLDQMSYNKDDYCYVSSTGIKQCTDRYYIAKMIPRYCAPFVDINCVNSQATVLVPNLVEAGANVIKLFIPKFSIGISTLDKGILKGTITHTTDDEYTEQILYTGKVKLEIKNSNLKVVDEKETEALDGVFESKLKLAKGEKVCAKIEFGGVIVTSDDFEGSESGGVFGLYEGPITVTFNKENWIAAEYERQVEKINNEQSSTQIKEIQIRNAVEGVQLWVETVIGNFQATLAQLKGGPKAKFQISKPQGMEYYFETSGLKYTLVSLSNVPFLPPDLTPLKDGSNAGTTLKTTANGFTAVAKIDNTTHTVTGVFKGNTLSGNWVVSMKGKVIWTGNFTTRKTYDLN
jgi:hypothetical protein